MRIKFVLGKDGKPISATKIKSKNNFIKKII